MKMNVIVAIHVNNSATHCDNNGDQRCGNSCSQSDLYAGKFCHAFDTILKWDEANNAYIRCDDCLKNAFVGDNHA
jgi:hypothetical protein